MEPTERWWRGSSSIRRWRRRAEWRHGNHSSDRRRACASWPTATRSRCSHSGSGRSPTGPSARTRCAGRWSSATGTSTPPRPTATRQVSGGGCATAACPATRSSSPPSSIPTVRTQRPRSSAASSASASTRSTSTSSTGQPAARGGRGRGWNARASAASRARSASRTSASPSSTSCCWTSRRHRSSTRSSSARSEFRRRLLQGCEERGVALEAYSPAGTGRHLRDRRVRQVAERVGRTPAQVLLRWCLQRNLVVLPKSTHRERIVDNACIFDFTLSAEDMAVLDALDKTGGTDRALGTTGGDHPSHAWYPGRSASLTVATQGA